MNLWVARFIFWSEDCVQASRKGVEKGCADLQNPRGCQSTACRLARCFYCCDRLLFPIGDALESYSVHTSCGTETAGKLMLLLLPGESEFVPD